ncbi:antibiotic biosynthesis monooxygenase family protein [Sediminibacillus halophilus]|uniref:Heme-degrading monooxygenase HmoA n=1 Tax=Sediminibacillus halophilus TaxID=482461 RepID=A0A1G9PN93_9BACI|nr:antibiotic biosynthesis monooxygenase [Sediminibacillus halophilus]SDM00073.1 Heme-degrading monooxygenase HmoA [Sediminibacillus halophilus]
MKAHITNGTYDFLVKIQSDYPDIPIYLMQAADSTMAYYEGKKANVFEQAREYESFVTDGELQQSGFVVMNNIPVTYEGKPIFEDQFKKRAGSMNDIPGFQALRVLRPLQGNKYVVMVQWDSRKSYQNWKDSDAFTAAHSSSKSKKRPPYHAGPSYTTEANMIEPA